MAPVRGSVLNEIDAIGRVEPQGWLRIVKDKRTLDSMAFGQWEDLSDLIEVIQVKRGAPTLEWSIAQLERGIAMDVDDAAHGVGSVRANDDSAVALRNSRSSHNAVIQSCTWYSTPMQSTRSNCASANGRLTALACTYRAR